VDIPEANVSAEETISITPPPAGAVPGALM
jgi:hypothetical protein